MPRVAWLSSLLMKVRSITQDLLPSVLLTLRAEMLTPIDQPLDKLEDLTPEEMFVPVSFHFSLIDHPSAYSENMKGMS